MLRVLLVTGADLAAYMDRMTRGLTWAWSGDDGPTYGGACASATMGAFTFTVYHLRGQRFTASVERDGYPIRLGFEAEDPYEALRIACRWPGSARRFLVSILAYVAEDDATCRVCGVLGGPYCDDDRAEVYTGQDASDATLYLTGLEF